MSGMGRTTDRQLGIAVAASVAACGDIDMRKAAGGAVRLASGAGGEYTAYTKINDTWEVYYDDENNQPVKLNLVSGRAKQLPPSLYDVSLLRLVGATGTVDLNVKS